jgi:glyoxylase-like metal-dependent hydrolase (beta-lactamase superfamily II)
MVGGFRVIDVPGHSPGHVAYWRESDQVLILGDVLTNMNLFTTLPGLHEPPRFFTVDPAMNRRSARKILELGLEPSLVCFGHGPPLQDTEKFLAFLRRLPD